MEVRAVSIMVLVNDLDRALAFYRDRLGLAVLNETSEWAALQHGIGLALAEDPVPPDRLALNAVMPAIEVPDVRAAFAELTSRGVAFLVPPTDTGAGIVASFVDSEGNALQLVESASRAVHG